MHLRLLTPLKDRNSTLLAKQKKCGEYSISVFSVGTTPTDSPCACLKTSQSVGDNAVLGAEGILAQISYKNGPGWFGRDADSVQAFFVIRAYKR